jgi:ribonuclease R
MPLLFRVHGEPDPQALERFAEVALALLPGTRRRDLETLPALRRFLAGLPEGPLSRLVHQVFLRSMKKAVYSSIDLGHFGLGIDRYCHFTSPIRRYPDLFNHRIVHWLIQHDEKLADESEVVNRWQAAAPAHAAACNRTEDRAETAEREMIRIKILRWAEKRLGETFKGRVVGLVGPGLFVELDKLPVEGFLPREGLPAGARYVEEKLGFFDRRSRFGLRLGDPVSVRIARVDLRERKLDFELVDSRPPRTTKGKDSKRKRAETKAAKKARSRGVGRRGAAVKKPGKRADRSRGRKLPRKQQDRRRRRGGKR